MGMWRTLPLFECFIVIVRFGKPTHVELKIYNVAGQLVRTLVNDQRAPNNYRVAWDGRNNAGAAVATGVYFYRLRAGAFTQTKKMVLLR